MNEYVSFIQVRSVSVQYDRVKICGLKQLSGKSFTFVYLKISFWTTYCAQVRIIDLRTVSFDVPPQEILTKDSVTVTVDAVVYYKVVAPFNATCNVEDYSKSTRQLASTTLRTILGTKSLTEILAEKEIIANDILHRMDAATDPWGINVIFTSSLTITQLLHRSLTNKEWRTVHTCLKCDHVNFKTPNQFLYHETDFGI